MGAGAAMPAARLRAVKATLTLTITLTLTLTLRAVEASTVA